MITRLYANNFRCLVAFESAFESFGVLSGANGAGKSSVFDAIRLIKNLAGGDSTLGGDREIDIDHLEFTSWLDANSKEVQVGIQEFEMALTVQGDSFLYTLHLEQVAHELKPRIIRERAQCNKRELFDRDLDGVRFQKASGIQKGFPLDWRKAALGSIQPAGDRREIEILQNAISGLHILRPYPREMETESRGESSDPDLYLTNLTSWYRSLSQEQDWTDTLRDSLKSIWPDFSSFRLVDAGRQSKALQLRFDSDYGREAGTLFFDQLSDGEKTLVGLYIIRSALATGAAHTILIDEPDNFVGLPELQPWVMSMMELLDSERQAIIISHHPEILDLAGSQFGRYLWRDNHTSPTRIGALEIPAGMTSGEAIARGWVGA